MAGTTSQAAWRWRALLAAAIGNMEPQPTPWLLHFAEQFFLP